MKRLIGPLFCCCFGIYCVPLLYGATTAVVRTPIADLRRIPVPPVIGHDDNENSQVLFGETVEVFESSGDYTQVRVPSQPKYENNRWQGYLGWIRSADLEFNKNAEVSQHVINQKWALVTDLNGAPIFQLPLGAWVHVLKMAHEQAEIDLFNGRTGWIAVTALKPRNRHLPALVVRAQILDSAKLLQGDPYLWGGLSPYDSTDPAKLSGVDCSGLVLLTYRVNGISIPRDSGDQYQQCRKIKRRQLKPGDLIFSAWLTNPAKIVHVALYAGHNELIEAPQTGLPVRTITFSQKFGLPLKGLDSGSKAKDRVVYFGRLLGE